MSCYFSVLSSDLLSGAKNLDSLKTLIKTNAKPLDQWFPVNNQNKFLSPNLDLRVDQAFIMLGTNPSLRGELEPYEEIDITFENQSQSADVNLSKLKEKSELPGQARTYVMIMSTEYKGTIIPGGKAVIQGSSYRDKQGNLHRAVRLKDVIEQLKAHFKA